MYKYEDVFGKSDTFIYVLWKSSGWAESWKFSTCLQLCVRVYI